MLPRCRRPRGRFHEPAGNLGGAGDEGHGGPSSGTERAQPSGSVSQPQCGHDRGGCGCRHHALGVKLGQPARRMPVPWSKQWHGSAPGRRRRDSLRVRRTAHAVEAARFAKSVVTQARVDDDDTGMTRCHAVFGEPNRRARPAGSRTRCVGECNSCDNSRAPVLSQVEQRARLPSNGRRLAGCMRDDGWVSRTTSAQRAQGTGCTQVRVTLVRTSTHAEAGVADGQTRGASPMMR